MACFVGIQIPVALREEIADFCAAYNYRATEPHIKVISPYLLENTPTIRHKLEAFCLYQPEFEVKLDLPVANGNQVLYFPVVNEGAALMRKNILQHFKLETAVAAYRPHLTIIRQKDRQYDLPRISEEARKSFPQPHSFKADHAALYVDEQGTGRFEPVMTVRLIGR